jgi:hypothetical protein
MWTVARFLYRGGWYMHPGSKVEFLFDGGEANVEYWSYDGAVIRAEGREYVLPPSNEKWATARVFLGDWGRVRIECVKGSVNIDRITAK